MSISKLKKLSYLCITMSTSRIYHSYHLDISQNGSNRVCYIILPECLKESEREWLDRMAEEHSASMVVISGLDWERELTPWKAPGLKAGEFAGRAQSFLDILKGDIMVNVESSLRISRPKRFIAGVSLSGLFALWASCRTHLFEGVASVSGSFWYDKFTEWFSTQEYCSSRYYFSLGEKEKDGKNLRLAAVEEETAKIMSTLQANEKEVIFEYNEGNHFGPLIERIEKAIINIMQ
jgi:predicted alpha/beta superfamily hydrolase